MAGDVRSGAEWRAVGLHRRSPAAPFHLDVLGQRPPGGESPPVDLERCQLRRSAGKGECGPGTPPALSVPVVKGDVSC